MYSNNITQSTETSNDPTLDIRPSNERFTKSIKIKKSKEDFKLIDKRWIRKGVWNTVSRGLKEYSTDFRTLTLTQKLTYHKCGVVALFVNNGKLAVGWSLCCDEDQFEERIAINVARDRAKTLFTNNKSRDLIDIELDKLPIELRSWVIKCIHNMASDYQVKELGC